jgi:hypothetical protein
MTPPRHPVAILKDLIASGAWYPYAIELDTHHTTIESGEELRTEAEASVAAFEAQFKPGVVYMPVPRCDACGHWDDVGFVPVTGNCVWLSKDNGCPVDTDAAFGCVQWKQK